MISNLLHQFESFQGETAGVIFQYNDHMTAKEIIEYFQKTYPGKNIVALPKANPTEIICEIDPSSEHLDRNVAIVAIKYSAPHYHKKAVETYKVLEGELRLIIDGQNFVLKQNDEQTIKPQQIHHAEGDFTLVEVVSEPGWMPEDHILV